MTHPYRALPDRSFWRRSVASLPVSHVDPADASAFRIAPSSKVATAGSCFAQHIARHLRTAGFRFPVTETAHPLVPAEAATAFGYGLFTARYGNIYTARQLLQLFLRAYGRFAPEEDAWQTGDGRWIDPFRPQIQPGGFTTRQELEIDRKHHLACVRQAFETLDVFVFTLGLTEYWSSRKDEAVFPVCPGVDGGVFDPEWHVFRNATAGETAADLAAFIDLLRSVNRDAHIILTVSPVPLVATATGRHVLTATTYSKAALRVAADEVCRKRDNVTYFPSFEIITGSFSRGAYFGEDCRSVTEDGVAHVMRVFLRNHTEGGTASVESDAAPVDLHTARMKTLVRVVCEEEALDRSP